MWIEQAKDFTGFYIEKVDLVDMVETEQEAKDIVAKLSANNDDDCVYKYSSSLPKSDWISINDQLPEKGIKVFLLDSSVRYPDNSWTGIYYGHGIWHKSNSIIPYSKGQVTHWMPLPSPPSEGLRNG